MRMANNTIEATKHMFLVCKYLQMMYNQTDNSPQTNVKGKVSISLDVWTSSNNYAFMAIVAHYITKAGELSMLINTLNQESRE